MTCPQQTIYVDNDPGANASTVTWDFSFSDNSLTAGQADITNDSFTIILTINGENVDPQLPKLLGIIQGNDTAHIVKYNVTDDARNSGFCSFFVQVSGEITHTCSRVIQFAIYGTYMSIFFMSVVYP